MRGLQVDGIVGPETMGDLDHFYAGGEPRPETPPDICSLLFSDQADDGSGLIALGALTPVQKNAARGLPKVDLGEGDASIECKTPTNKKDCAALC